MIDGLKPYPEYQASGQMWMGNIPQNWDILPNRAIFEEVKDRGHPDEEMLSVTIKRGVILQKTLLSDSSKKDSSNQNKSAYKLVCPNDIAYNKMRAWQGAIGASNFRGIVSPAYIVMRLRKKYNPRYFHYLFRTPHFAKEAERWSYGITSDMWSLRPEHFKMIYTPLPPKDEQTAIVKFLDHATRKLNRAIRAKQKVIALLSEQKQVIIHQAVTRGLDPDVLLKPSGIPWIRDFPKHWEATSLRRYWQVVDCKHVTVSFFEEGFPLASVVEVQSFYLDLSRSNKTSSDWYQVLIEGGRKPKRRDIIYCRNVSVGASAFVDTDLDFAMGQDVCLIRSETQNQKFLNYLLRSQFMTHQLELLLVGSTFKRINIGEIKALLVLIPPIQEQEQICKYLDRATVEFNTLINKTEGQIALLQEFRTRLITDVITGKVDVREAARRIPDETEADDFAFENGEFFNGHHEFDLPGLTDRKELDEIDSNILKYGTGANQ
jgi:type I restriction enzyme S subunit